MLEQHSVFVPFHIIDEDYATMVDFLRAECKKCRKKFQYVDGIGSRTADGYEVVVIVSKSNRVLIRRDR